jgi:predicted DNA-binding protein with PD1-like motif
MMAIRAKSLALFLAAASVPSGQHSNPAQIATAPPATQNAGADAVPDVYAIPAHIDRIVVLRLKYDTDLLAGIEKMVKQEQIRNGVILAAIGSLRGYQIDQISNRDFPSKNTMESNPTSPAEMVGMNGYIIGGRVHAHVTLATPERAIAGHLQYNTHVFTSAIVTIAVMNDSNFNRIDDQTYR